MPEETYWIRVFDWSRLRKLHAPMSDFLNHVLATLGALEDLKIVIPASGRPATFPIHKELAAALKSIDIQSMGCLDTEGIIRHGASLQ